MGRAATEPSDVLLDVVTDDVRTEVSAKIEERVLGVAHIMALSQAVILVEDQQVWTVDGALRHDVDSRVAFLCPHLIAATQISCRVRSGTVDSDKRYAHAMNRQHVTTLRRLA